MGISTCFHHLIRLLFLAISLQALLIPRSLRKVVVIGGGAAGYYSAISCAERLRLNQIRAEVVLLECGRIPLTKVAISGGGRCNVMHDPTVAVTDIAQGYPRGRTELLEPLSSKFSPSDTYQWFNERGARLKTERDGRVFPSSDLSQTIVDILEQASVDLEVQVQLQSRVKSIEKTTKGFCVTFLDDSSSDVDSTRTLDCDRVILATGSAKTGHEIMEKFGHSPIHTVPSLFSFKISDPELTELAGLSSECAKVKLIMPPGDAAGPPIDKRDLIQRGPLLITKQGMSGPSVLKLSAFAAPYLAAKHYNCSMSINWVGDLTVEQIAHHLETEKMLYPNRQVGKYFPYLTPELQAQLFKPGFIPRQSVLEEGESIINRRLWLYLLKRCQIDGGTVVWQSVSKEKIRKIAEEVTRSVFKVVGRGLYKDEFVTCGGVSLQEMNMETLESRLVPGVYAAGEILDIDGITGGFNFQSAWTTGYIAGTSCADSLTKTRKSKGNVE